MTRVSTAGFVQQSLNAILEQQSRINKLVQQMSSGKKYQLSSDAPVQTERVTRLEQSLKNLERLQINVASADARLSMAESALDGVIDILQRAHEINIEGGNGTSNNEDREALAQELQEAIDSLAGLANTQDENGVYVFSGFKGNTQTYTQNSSGTYTYNGDDGQRFLTVSLGVDVAISDSGFDIFENIKTGNGTFAITAGGSNAGTAVADGGAVTNLTTWNANVDTYDINFTSPTAYEVRDSSAALVTSGTYTDGEAISFNGIEVTISGTPATNDTFEVAPSSGQSLFTTAQNLVNALNATLVTDQDRAAYRNDLNRNLAEINEALEYINLRRTEIGGRLNTVDRALIQNRDFTQRAESVISTLEDLDYAEALTEFNLEQVALTAAQQSYVTIQGLSLVNFL